LLLRHYLMHIIIPHGGKYILTPDHLVDYYIPEDEQYYDNIHEHSKMDRPVKD